MDVSSFMNRKGLVQRELAEMLGVSTSTVGGWCVSRIKPSFDMCQKLIECGISPVELFGEEVARKLFENAGVSENPANASDINDVVRQMLIDSISKILESLKANVSIKK